MTQLDGLPLELILLIAQNLSNQKDINALVQTNWQLYQHLHGFLCRYNIQHHQGKALSWAAKKGYTSLAKELLDAGANIAVFESFAQLEPKGWHSDNPIVSAASKGHLATLKLLLSETRPRRACTPAQLRQTLQWALRVHNQKLTELLLKHKAPLEPEEDDKMIARFDVRNNSALGYAVSFKFSAIIPLLVEHGAQPGSYECPGPVERAIIRNQPEMAELLLKLGVPQTSDLGLCYVVEHNKKALFQLLVDFGMEMDLWGHLPLFWAIMYGNCEMVELLVNHGANPHLLGELVIGLWEDLIPMSSVGFALYFGHLDIVKLLLEKGVQPELSDLRLAENKKYDDVVATLSGLSYEEVEQRESVEVYTMSRAQRRAAQDPKFRILFIRCPLADPIENDYGI